MLIYACEKQCLLFDQTRIPPLSCTASSPSAAYRKKLRQELYYCQKYGIKSHLDKIGDSADVETYRSRLLGRVNYVLQITPNNKEMQDYKNWLCRK